MTTTKRRHPLVANKLAPGATLVAAWASLFAYGEDLLAADVDEAGWTGDGIALLRNALLFAVEPR